MSGTPAGAKRAFWIGVGVLAVGVVILLLAPKTENTLQQTIHAREDRVLKETDLNQLRDACRSMIVKYGDPNVKHIAPTDDRVPPIVRRLEPTDVILVENYLRIELGDERYYYGLEAFRDQASLVPFPVSRELVEGLWFYDGVNKKMVNRFAH